MIDSPNPTPLQPDDLGPEGRPAAKSAPVMIYRGQVYSPLEVKASENPGDPVSRYLRANELAEAGDLSSAAVLYQEVYELDPTGVYGSYALKALEALQAVSPRLLPQAAETAVPNRPSVPASPNPEWVDPLADVAVSPFQGLYDLPLRSKLIGLVVTQVLTLLALGVVGLGGMPAGRAPSPPIDPEAQEAPLQPQTLGRAGLILCIALLNLAALALFWQSVSVPLLALHTAMSRFREGQASTRAAVAHQDEIGQMAVAFNTLADQVAANQAVLADEAGRQNLEVQLQRQEKEQLQQEVINLLLEIEGAQRGDLTVQAPITTGEVGSIADAFNATIASLRQLVLQVRTVANQVGEVAAHSEHSVQQLSAAATAQAAEVVDSLAAVETISHSIEEVAGSAQEAATIAREALLAAQSGDARMDQTVETITAIRGTVAATAKMVKRLAESSQEISQIVGIISGISEKTNLLAFNASIEATRAGEHGQGFRVVADEVRRLAQRVTEATKDIEQLVTNIQQETAQVLQAMEASTSEVVAGTQLVAQTKETLQNLATTSQRIDQFLQSISASTVSQATSSQQVQHQMEDVADIARTTAQETQVVAASLQQLVQGIAQLQTSVSRFRLEK